ncbi:DIS3-like exonuclease 2 [Apium graveolens]|uniref:DIS3-like exonuclease 2 n=1 Tax=Apium graveolens TaxID=4045 RepID=UPI003D7B0953
MRAMMILDPHQAHEFVDSKDKKKKRRSNRKSKQISPPSDEEIVQQEGGIITNQRFLRSCPQPIACEKSVADSNARNGYHSSRHSQLQRKYYTSYWSKEAVTAALEKGDVVRALFRVNAHNRLEAYCKIEGVPVDILICGTAAQNRAVEGDIVVIKLDPLSLWTKMKGSSGASGNASPSDDCNLVPVATLPVSNNFKGKDKVGNDFYDERNTYHSENGSQESVALAGNGLVNGNTLNCCSGEHHDFVTVEQRLCTMTSAFPLKRPTGKVVAIIEKSRRRDGVVGFLDVKHWGSNRKDYSENSEAIQLPLLFSSMEYIAFIPNDSKFPKMMVPIRSLPDCMKKRLEVGDATVGTELVAAQIVNWGEEDNGPEAHVIRVFGCGGDLEPCIAAILFENAIHSFEFSSETLSCLPNVNWVVPLKEYQTRQDIRNLCIFTIDPASTTDVDDALSVNWLSSDICRVGVHIADASYFVLPDTALDVEAQFRSTSVYLLRRKLPMLPPLLSENLGSLNPGVERLAFSIFWDINLSGEVLDRWIGRTIMQSCCKLSYEHAQNIIDGKYDDESFTTLKNGLPHMHGQFQWSNVVESVKSLHAISKTLKEKRYNDGALSLANPKLDFLFNEDGSPYDFVFRGTMESKSLVEEFMLLANRTAAEVITRAYPSTALLRRHPEPNLRKLIEFETFCCKHGLSLDISSSGKLHLSLERIRQELKDDSVLFDILLSYATRPMQMATYFCSGNSEECENDWGHFALAVPLYTHFTSPLRRYPDIVVHRTLAAVVKAEEIYMKKRSKVLDFSVGRTRRCFTSIYFDKDAVESHEAEEALSVAAGEYSVPCTEMLKGVAAHCNERKLASRHVNDATVKLYLWLLLRKEEVLFSKARVVGLGPRFMSIYIEKLAMERRIYYDEVEGLTAEWLDATCTLVLSLSTNKRIQRRGSPANCRPLEEVVLIVSPHNLMPAVDSSDENRDEVGSLQIEGDALASVVHSQDVEPAVFPLTVRSLSTISVALHAVGGDDGPHDVGARLFVSSYFG